jgi:hypothetical protein
MKIRTQKMGRHEGRPKRKIKHESYSGQRGRMQAAESPPMSERDSRDKIIAKAKFDLANKIRMDIGLTPSTRLVGLYIADHINTKRGYAWCTQEQIAADLGIDERTVRRGLKT